MASGQRTTVQDVSDSDSESERRITPLPNTGIRGALLQEVGDASDPDEPMFEYDPPAAGASSSGPFQTQHTQVQYRNAAELEKYKRWTSLYPIYFDAKRPYGQGQRRLAREKSVWWPQSRDIEVAARILGIPTLHEPTKRHPQDWENPGRVKVLWKENGKILNQRFSSKKRLLEAIAQQIQVHKPEQVPTPETSVPIRTPSRPTNYSTKSSSLPKNTGPVQRKSFRVPQPPEPWPKLQDRVSSFSPMIDAGIYVDAVSNALAAEKKAESSAGAIAGQGQGQSQGAGAGKGKKKVIRVRG